METAKIMYDWGFLLLKMLKQHAAGDLFKGLNKISNSGGFISWERPK